MTPSRPPGRSNRDELFTVTINLMWELYYEASEHHVPWAAEDLLVAISELDVGPWRHLGRTTEIPGLPFTVRCVLLDRLLEELGRLTPGFGARVAIAGARAWLDPGHQP